MSEHVEQLLDENFKEGVREGVSLVDFYATWCAPCRMIAPIIEELAKTTNGKARIAKVDIDQAQEVAQDLQITSVPTLILFKDGVEVKRIVGVKDLDYLTKLIESVS
jgi:thioredoxin 1